MVIEAFNQKVSSLAKTIACEKNDYSLFKENIVKLDNHIDALYFFNALQAASYVVDDYNDKKGSSALDFTKTRNKISDANMVTTSGYSVSIPHEKILQLSSSAETENSLISNMLKELYLSADRSMIKNCISLLLSGRISTEIENSRYTLLKLDSIINSMCSYNDEYIETNAKNIYIPKKEDIVVLMNTREYGNIIGANATEMVASHNLLNSLNVKYVDVLPPGKIIIYDKNYLNIFSQDETLEMVKNPKYNFTNYFLRVKNTVVLNPFYKSLIITLV